MKHRPNWGALTTATVTVDWLLCSEGLEGGPVVPLEEGLGRGHMEVWWSSWQRSQGGRGVRGSLELLAFPFFGHMACRCSGEPHFKHLPKLDCGLKKRAMRSIMWPWATAGYQWHTWDHVSEQRGADSWNYEKHSRYREPHASGTGCGSLTITSEIPTLEQGIEYGLIDLSSGCSSGRRGRRMRDLSRMYANSY